MMYAPLYRKIKISLIFIIVSFNCFSQKKLNLSLYHKIQGSFDYDYSQDIIEQKVLPKMNDFYWEYRFRKNALLKRDSLLKIYGFKRTQDIKKIISTDYSVILHSAYRNKDDSLKIRKINADEGCIPSCLPNGNCFFYIICVKNDSISIINRPDLLHKFMLPIDSNEKALLWAVWNDYAFSINYSNSGYYRKTDDGFELIAEKTIDAKQRKNGKWKEQVALIRLRINYSGEISETTIKTKSVKSDFKIVI